MLGARRVGVTNAAGALRMRPAMATMARAAQPSPPCSTEGHDVCHGGLTPYDLLNKILGRIALLPSCTPYIAWEFAHNRVHYSYTNHAWAPFSKEEYDRLPRLRRWLERHYRSVWGFGSYYLVEYWLKHLMCVAKKERQENEAACHVRAGSCSRPGLRACSDMGPLRLVRDAGRWREFLGAPDDFSDLLLVGIVLPFLVWNWGMGIAIFQHHNHPRAVWYANREEWDFFAGQVGSTVHARMPRWIDWISAFIMQHTAHHVNSRIPLYRLAQSQRYLERAYADQIIV
jgi:acyl-lipid omega-6 desaturase (Delta-12 desaturase)